MKGIFEMLRQRRERAERSLHDRGFDYAAGQLLRGVLPEQLEAEANNGFDTNNFDRGMLDALRVWAWKENHR